MSAVAAPTGNDEPIKLEDIIPDYRPANATASTVFGKVRVQSKTVVLINQLCKACILKWIFCNVCAPDRIILYPGYLE